MKIGEVSEKYEISSDTLQYCERIGPIPTVNRNESGIREYTELDIRRIDFIYLEEPYIPHRFVGHQ